MMATLPRASFLSAIRGSRGIYGPLPVKRAGQHRARQVVRAQGGYDQDGYSPSSQTRDAVACTRFDPADSGLVVVSADHSVRVPAPPPNFSDYAPPPPGTELGSYMMMPAEQFVLIDLPLGAYMARIDTDTFQLVIQEISFFGFELRPIIHVRVTHTAYPRPAVQLEAIEFSFDGSDIVKSFSDICEVKGKTVFTWVEGGPDQAIFSETLIRLYGKPPPPLNVIPKQVFQQTANTILNTLLSAMQGPFVSNIVKDYQRWATDARYREERSTMQQADVIDAAAYPQGSYPPYDAGGYPQDQQGYYRPPGGAPGPDAYRYDPRGAQWGSYPGSAGQGQYPGYQEQYPGDYRGYGQGEGDSQGYPPRDWRA